MRLTVPPDPHPVPQTQGHASLIEAGLRNGRRSHSQNGVATATIPAVVHVESAGSEACDLDQCLNPEHADIAKVDEADAAGTV